MNSTLPLSSKITVAPHVLLRELDGEAVLLNLANESYYGLDQIATHMWKTLLTAESLRSAIVQLQQEYAVDSEQLEMDIHRLVVELEAEGLVHIDYANVA